MVPGTWLDGSSREAVLPVLERGSGASDPGEHHFSNCVTIRLALGIMEPNS
jgi:hypothetical protein